MQDVQMIWNPGSPLQKQRSARIRIFTNKLDLNWRKKLEKCYISSIVLYGIGTWILRKLDQKCLKSFEAWCRRRMERIIWTDCMKNEEVLHSAKKDRNILRTIKRRTATWIFRIFRRNYFLKLRTEGKIEGEGRRRRRSKQLLDDVKNTRMYWKLKEGALDCAV